MSAPDASRGSLAQAFDLYRTLVSDFYPQDLDTIGRVTNTDRLGELLGALDLSRTQHLHVAKVRDHLEPIVRAVSASSEEPELTQAYIWGSVFVICQASSEVFKSGRIHDCDVLQLLYKCSLNLPPNRDVYESGRASSGLKNNIEEVYTTLLIFFGKIIGFFRDHQHASEVKRYWSSLTKLVDEATSAISSLSRRLEDELKNNSANPGDIDELKELVLEMRLSRGSRIPLPVDCIPQVRNRFFQGREKNLEELHKHLQVHQSDNRFASIALSGFGGAGKTQLALQLAHSCSKASGASLVFFPILWICAAGREKMEQDIYYVASQLNILPEGTNPAERAIRAKKELLDWLATTDHQWMIIFDNVSNFDDIAACWPSSRPGCAAVITSRNYGLGGTEISLRHRVDPLDIDDTANLILSILGQVPRTTENLTAARQIARELGGIPLAVTQIGSYILENGVGLRNFLPLYRKRWKKIHQSKVYIPDYEHQDCQDTLTNMWGMSSQRLGANAKVLGEVIAFLQPDRIPESFFMLEDVEDDLSSKRTSLGFSQDELSFIEAKNQLERAALLQIGRDSGDMQVHRLSQTVVLDSMTEDGSLPERFEDAVSLVKRAFPKLTSATVPNAYKNEMWHLAQDCLPHVLNLEELYLTFRIPLTSSSELPRLLSDASWYLYETGQFERALTLLKTAEKVCEGNERLRASTRSIRALIYHHQNFQEGAKKIWEENLALRERLDGPEHFLVGGNLCNLGAAYGELGDVEKCIDFFERGQAHRLKHHPEHHSDLGLHYCNFGSYLIHYSRLDEAEVIMQKSLSHYRRCETDESFGYNQALFFLAKLRTAQKRYKEALALHTKALTTRRKIMRNHYYTCVSFYHTADVADLVGDHRTAVGLLDESLRAFEAIPEARNYVARSFFRLSRIYETTGKPDDARANLEKAQAILVETGIYNQGLTIEDYEQSMPIRFR